jgi:hydroxymethylpyrimidine pyrophosphatase-like HAD family hydrolase
MQRITDAIIVAGNNTLWRGNVAAGIRKEYVIRRALAFDFAAVKASLRGTKHVKEVVKASGVNGEAEGLKALYQVLTENGMGRESEMRAYAYKYIRRHEITAVRAIIVDAKPDILTHLATIGGSTAANVAETYFNIFHCVSNRDIFQDGWLAGIELLVRNGEEKLSATVSRLEEFNLKIERCAVIGASEEDIPLLKAAGQRFASPMANDEVKRIPGITQIRG